ncbi:hypothetical protein ANN_05784 [Periplaneta americana]|uniref:RNase H type-1 domain-containing protein n=1 Tax=Periplaneta americana TaxID=6978 RepID=A0ABQ8TBS1_PERAM|nr:hypothetical protein ANN_05784 [Periplaneta americana]
MTSATRHSTERLVSKDLSFHCDFSERIRGSNGSATSLEALRIVIRVTDVRILGHCCKIFVEYNIVKDKMLSQLISLNKGIVFQWIPSHCGILGNENADALAMKGSTATYSPVTKSTFLQRWIGCGSSILPVPLDWPPRSPDFTSCDNALWGFIKGIVAQERYDIIDELKNAVRRVFDQITPTMLSRMSHRTWNVLFLCEENDEGHTDIFGHLGHTIISRSMSTSVSRKKSILSRLRTSHNLRGIAQSQFRTSVRNRKYGNFPNKKQQALEIVRETVVVTGLRIMEEAE